MRSRYRIIWQWQMVERAYTYEELAVAASQAVKVLQEIGIKEKDAVLVECTQKATFLILDLACEQIGAVFIPLERKMTEARVCSIYEETEAKCVIAETVYEVAHFCSLTDLLEKMEMQPHTWEAYEEKKSGCGDSVYDRDDWSAEGNCDFTSGKYCDCGKYSVWYANDGADGRAGTDAAQPFAWVADLLCKFAEWQCGGSAGWGDEHCTVF